jgi:hypothetical protein
MGADGKGVHRAGEWILGGERWGKGVENKRRENKENKENGKKKK